MPIPKLLIVLSAIVFGGFGALFLVWPEALAELVGSGLAGAPARAEVRAMYGGLELGLSAFLLWCARAEGRFEAGLMATALSFFGLAAGRVAGMALGGAWTPAMLGALAAETVACALAGWGLAMQRRQSRQHRP